MRYEELAEKARIARQVGATMVHLADYAALDSSRGRTWCGRFVGLFNLEVVPKGRVCRRCQIARRSTTTWWHMNQVTQQKGRRQ